MLIDIAISLYIAARFLLRSSWPDRPTVAFARGAFRRDIPTLADAKDLIVINTDWLRRLIRQRVPDAWLEQVLTLDYRQPLRGAFPITLKTLSHFVRRRPTRLIFGGVDYFEVALFGDHGFYADHTSIVAVFHENYAIDYVANVNRAVYASVREPFIFDEVYTYGPPATRILRRFTRETTGPRAKVMPRLAGMEDNARFHARLATQTDPAVANTVLLLAFPGTEYLAPVCFSATLLQFAALGAQGTTRAVVKFKNEKSARPSRRQCGRLARHLEWKFDGSIEALVWQAGFTVVFNSISFYEALLGPTIIIVPNYLDAQHDQNLLQESPQTMAGLRTVRFAESPGDIGTIMRSFDIDAIRRLVGAERSARKAAVARKFYLTASQATIPDRIPAAEALANGS
jgi:hypothetical protein